MAKIADSLKLAGELEGKLNGKLFFGGNTPSEEDVKLFNQLFGAENTHVTRWVKHMASYTPAERTAWGAPVKVTAPEAKPIDIPTPAPAAPAAKKVETKPVAAVAAAPKKEEKPVAKPADDDDDVDLFGEETEEDKAALAAKKASDAEKAKAKKVVIAKSSILMDIKVWDDTIDLVALGEKIRSNERDGLLWGDHKLVPVAFGVKKLQQLLVIEDDKVSSDDIEDLIMQYEDEVQSMDIVAWNKI